LFWCAAAWAATEECVRTGCEYVDECGSVVVLSSLVEWVAGLEWVLQSGRMGYECSRDLVSPLFEWAVLECDDEQSGAKCDGLTVTWESRGACAVGCVCDGCEVVCRSVVLVGCPVVRRESMLIREWSRVWTPLAPF
jgi:hypothetical protein